MRVSRKAVNLSLDADLVDQARAQKMNLSAIAEAAIRDRLVKRAREEFESNIARGVAAYEEYLAEYGSLADAMRASGDE